MTKQSQQLNFEKRTEEAAKFKRVKVPLGWDVFSKEQKKVINAAVDKINAIFSEKNLPLLPSDYKREL